MNHAQSMRRAGREPVDGCHNLSLRPLSSLKPASVISPVVSSSGLSGPELAPRSLDLRVRILREPQARCLPVMSNSRCPTHHNFPRTSLRLAALETHVASRARRPALKGRVEDIENRWGNALHFPSPPRKLWERESTTRLLCKPLAHHLLALGPQRFGGLGVEGVGTDA